MDKDENRGSHIEGNRCVVGDYPLHFGRAGEVGDYNNLDADGLGVKNVTPAPEWATSPTEITPAMVEAARDVLDARMDREVPIPSDDTIAAALRAALNAKSVESE